MRWIYVAIISCSSTLVLLGSIGQVALSVIYYKTYAIPDFPIRWTTLILIWMWAGALTDMLLSGSYIVALHRKMGRSGNEITNNVVQMISLLVIRSTSYTAILALVAAILTQTLDSTDATQYLIPYAFWMPLPAAYTLSLFTFQSISDRVINKLSDFPTTNFATTGATSLPRSKIHCGGSSQTAMHLHLKVSRTTDKGQTILLSRASSFGQCPAGDLHKDETEASLV